MTDGRDLSTVDVRMQYLMICGERVLRLVPRDSDITSLYTSFLVAFAAENYATLLERCELAYTWCEVLKR